MFIIANPHTQKRAVYDNLKQNMKEIGEEHYKQ